MQINILGSGHDLSGEAQYWGFTPFSALDDQWRVTLLIHALGMIAERSFGKKDCNERFQSMPGGRSFDQVFKDDEVWISLLYAGNEAAGQTVDKDIGISNRVFDDAQGKGLHGIAQIAATLIHEMAHVNGVDRYSMVAEDAVIPCGFPGQYNKDAHKHD